LLVDTDLTVMTRDGVPLATDVYRPDSAAPVPVLVQRTPYDKNHAGLVSLSLDVLRAVRSGYAVVVQDTRGRYASGGSFTPFVHEGADGADTLAWAAAQPWSTGDAAMFGASYLGAAQWLAAMEGPPSLRALAPHLTAASYGDGWATRGGAFELGFNLTWALGSLATGEVLRRRPARGALLEHITRVDRTGELLGALPLGALPLDALAPVPHYRDWLRAPPSLRVEHERVDVPALNIGGWFDLFLEGTLDNFRPGGRLVVGPWSHTNPSGTFAERLFGALASADGADLTGEQLRWFDQHLRGGPPAAAPVRLFVIGADEWRDFDGWPPPGTDMREHFLHGGGRLLPSPPAGGDPERFRYDPRDPVPTVGGATFLPGGTVAANAGPRDQRGLDARRDVLRYVGAPLARAAEVVGTVELVLFASSSAPSTDFTAKLVDVHPDGRAELVTDGIVRARLRPGEVTELRIRVGSTAWRFRAGHRLRVDVSSSNFPRFDRNPNTGGASAEATEDDLVVAVNAVHHESRYPSRLVLPTLDDS
jgi:putative CocE/NonD family hydrolase